MNLTYTIFENTTFPCLWLGNDDTFWMNASAKSCLFFDGNEVKLRNALAEEASVSTQTKASRVVQLFSGSNSYLFTLLPLPSGILATASEEATMPISALASQLREPINGVFATLPSLTKKLNSEDTVYIEDIQRRCYELLRITSNMESIYRVPRVKNINLAELAQSVFQSAMFARGGQPVSISTDIPESLTLVAANEQALSETLLNILRNSLQYTRDGNHIHMRLRRTGNMAHLTIEDKGLGIRPKHLPHIFDAYFSADPYGDDAPAPGLGLGLYVSQQTARRFGGSIAAESEFGKGTRITLSLPLTDSADIHSLESDTASYLANRYSLLYIHLCGFCRLPDLF